MQTTLKYYHNYDLVYQELKKQKKLKGHASSDSLKEFLSTEVFERLPKSSNYKFLEAGCGPCSLFEDLDLKDLNPKVLALDISETAIEVAKHFSQNKNISYMNQDICNLEIGGDFDLVIDAHCLHCLTDDVDRALYLNNVHSSLKLNGLFALECMISHEDLRFENSYFYDSDQILFKLIDNENFKGLNSFEGYSYMPIRKIPTSLTIEEELLSSGFKILYFMAYSNLKIPVDPYISSLDLDLDSCPEVLRVICTKF